MKSSPVLSIIIPVYNSMSTIGRTLNSLIYNTYDLEIICVNDGSMDETESIINDYAKKDKRIRQIIQENRGASAARNTGIMAAKAEYLLFCDADDEFGNNVLDCVISDIKLYSPDCIVFDRETIFVNESRYRWLRNNNKCLVLDYNWIDYFNKILFERNHSYVVFNKVYKASIIKNHNVLFNERLKLSEDLFFNFSYLRFAESMVEDGRAQYIQHKRANSLTTTRRDDYYYQDTKILELINEEYAEYVSQFQPFINKHVLNVAEQAIRRALKGRDGDTWREKREISETVLNDKKVTSAIPYVQFESEYVQKKWWLIRHRMFALFKLRYILLPQFKEKILRI